MDSIQIDLKCGNILAQQDDVLVLKHAQGLFGVDLAVVRALRQHGAQFELPPTGEHLFVSSLGAIPASHVLFMGVVPLPDFEYEEIRSFARQAIAALAREAPQTASVSFTLHGVGFGLDEQEAFKSELAGLLEAIHEDQFPEGLRTITIVELDRGRTNRLTGVLDSILPEHSVPRNPARRTVPASRQGTLGLRDVGAGSAEKPHVFVAMPFAEEMDDVYHYGIQSAVNAAGYLCERADLSAFTGDILDRVRSRIRSASLLVADLSGANANVYLEVGYAWGVGVPTVLVVRNPEDLKFDVRGQRCLVYKKIQELEGSLTRELTALKDIPSGD